MQRLIKLGAKRIVVPGNLPTGCIPIMLTLYASPNKRDYDTNGCLVKLNGLARYHNALLWREVRALRTKYPDTKIAYADYFKPVVKFLQKPTKFGEIIHVSIACQFCHYQLVSFFFNVPMLSLPIL